MGLMRSLQAGITGLRNHQLFMDVVGNNIANVNTVGFKSGRVTFGEMFAQTIRGTTRPAGGNGGTNPIQVGLGTAVSTIDTLFSAGNIETTGQSTDLAIQGDGFFVVSDGNKRFYTRAGFFRFNADGTLTMPSNGLKVQGYLANASGEIDAAKGITDIKLSGDQKVPAHATSSIAFTGNLNAALEPIGTILKTAGLLAIEEPGDNSDVNGLYARGNANNKITGMSLNNSTITITDGAGNSETYIYVDTDVAVDNNAFHSLDDLILEINSDFGAAGSNSFTASLNASGQLVFTDLSGAANDIVVDSSNVVMRQALQGLNGDVSAGPLASDEFSHVAREDDLLINLRDNTGASLGLTDTDVITINGVVGGTAGAPGTLTITPTTTYQDFANQVETTLGITNDGGVEIDDNDGALVINGDGGKIYEITSMNIVATDATGTTSRSIFDGIFDSTVGNYVVEQKAKDAEQAATVTIFDSLGNDYDLTLVFTKDVQQPNRWLWKVNLPEGFSSLGGDSGYVKFNNDGSLQEFVFDDGSSTIQLSPGSNAEALNIALEPGEQNTFEGLTQLSGANANSIIVNQDGFGMGVLERINIDTTGRIIGEYSNGVNQALAQLLIANFNNPGGLVRKEGSLFAVSGNSGDAQFSTAGSGFNSQIISGALEQSNVDLAEEFTKMIVAQRGFQASARTITVSDEMLSEVTNLKR